MIPKSVTRTDLLTAMEPLYTLLGITAGHVYSVPGMTITGNSIVLCTPPEDNIGRLRRGSIGLQHPQRDPDGQLMCVSTVAIEDPAR